MKDRIASALLVLVGVLNLTPATVFFVPSQMGSLYGLELPADDLGIIVRHRAVLLGLLGAAMIYAAFRKNAVVPVVTGAMIGKVAFLFLVWSVTHTAEMEGVAMFDIGAIAALVVVLALNSMSREG